MQRFILSIIGLTLAACETAPVEVKNASDIRHISSQAYRDAGFPFSPAVEADGWLFLSGALGAGADGALVTGGIRPETRQAMDNIAATLSGEGIGWDRVVKCTVMLVDISEWSDFNEIYKTYFDGHYPARSALGANGLALGARVEIECIARR